MTAPRLRSRTELRGQRRPRPHSCWNHLIAAPLWPLHGANLGTLLRTCDAVGACLAVPRYPWVPEALARGTTLRRPSCVHWLGRDVNSWLARQRDDDTGASLNVAVAGSLVRYRLAGLL